MYNVCYYVVSRVMDLYYESTLKILLSLYYPTRDAINFSSTIYLIDRECKNKIYSSMP